MNTENTADKSNILHDELDRIVSLRDVVDVLLTEGLLQGYIFIKPIKPCHGACCCCMKCGRLHDDCVCAHNELLHALKSIPGPDPTDGTPLPKPAPTTNEIQFEEPTLQNSTPGAKWREEETGDPHGKRYDCERAQLCMGKLTDDELANAAFLNYDIRPPIQDLIAGKAFSPIAYMTAVKDRIRWLSRKLEEAISESKVTDAPDSKSVEASDEGSDEYKAFKDAGCETVADKKRWDAAIAWQKKQTYAAHQELVQIHTIGMCIAECPPATDEDSMTVRMVKDMAYRINKQKEAQDGIL